MFSAPMQVIPLGESTHLGKVVDRVKDRRVLARTPDVLTEPIILLFLTF